MRLWLVLLLLAASGLAALEFEVQWRHPEPRADLPWKQLRKSGCLKLILPVFNTDQESGGLYFGNPFTPVLKPDLSVRIAESRKKGPELWAWMITRNFSFLKDSALFDSALLDGELRPVLKLDLASDRVLAMLEKLYALLAQTGVRGVLIQDDLVYRVGEAFSAAALEKFRLRSGIVLKPGEFDRQPQFVRENWQRFKQNLILQALDTIMRSCRAVSPGIRIGINIYYESPLWSAKSEQWYAQNFREMLAAGPDLVYLMAYHRQMQRELGIGPQRCLELFREITAKALDAAGDRLVVKLQFRDFETKEAVRAEELLPYLLALPNGVRRVIFISVEKNDLGEISRLMKLYAKAIAKD